MKINWKHVAVMTGFGLLGAAIYSSNIFGIGTTLSGLLGSVRKTAGV